MRDKSRDNCIRSFDGRRLLAALCALVLAAAQLILLWPAFAQEAHAETAGDELSVRVQYFGERGDLIREKVRFTRDELESMGSQVWYYSNVTSVGTVMSMAAHGPEVLTIIENAGIDPGAVMNITFRTTDGYTRNFTVEQHLSGGRYFYPHLSAGYERNDEGTALTPLPGSLADAVEVPSILALEFGATKAPGVDAASLTMGTKQTYRFCMGQSPLQEGAQSRPGQDGGDVSSMDSVHSIYGIDITLAGSPVSGIGIDPVDTDMKIGSVTKLTIHVSGDELFADEFSSSIGKLTWTSSDPSVATVDQEGNVTILKEGRVTITVTAANGMSASVVIKGTGKVKKDKPTAEATREKETSSQPRERTTQATEKKETKRQPSSATTQQTKAPEKPKVHLRELSLGGRIEEKPPKEEAEQRAMEQDTQALEKQRDHAPGTVAGASTAAVLACGAGGAIRFRRFRQILKGWKR